MDTVSLNRRNRIRKYSSRHERSECLNPVLLDTNALIMPFQFSIDIESELKRLLGRHTIFVPSSVIEELNKLSLRNPMAKAGLKLVRRYRVINIKEKGDESILRLAIKINAVVVTNDMQLRKTLRKHNVSVIFMRNKSRLVMI